MNPSQMFSKAAAITFAAGIALAGTGEHPPGNPANGKESRTDRHSTKTPLKKRKATGSNLPVNAATVASTYVSATTSTRVCTQHDFAWEGGDVARFLRKQPGIH